MFNDIILYGPLLEITLPINTDTYPVQRFDWTYNMRGDTVNKPQTAGRWPTSVRADAMLITCEGLILSPTTAQLAADRADLLNIVVPKRVQTVNALTQYLRHSRILITLLSAPAVPYYADVVLQDMSLPVSTEVPPTVQPFQFNWMCNAGYWTNLTTGETAYI